MVQSSIKKVLIPLKESPTNLMVNKKIILSIAGSDNGVQADIKTCQLLKVYCVNVITLVTSQIRLC